MLQTTSARVAPQSLARLSARQILDGYRARHFTPRDVIDEVISALESTDALCKIIATDMFESARAEADRAVAAWKSWRSEGTDRCSDYRQGSDLCRGNARQGRRSDAGRFCTGR